MKKHKIHIELADGTVEEYDAQSFVISINKYGEDTGEITGMVGKQIDVMALATLIVEQVAENLDMISRAAFTRTLFEVLGGTVDFIEAKDLQAED